MVRVLQSLSEKKIEHTNVVGMKAYYETETSMFFLYELTFGEMLSETSKKEKSLSEKQVKKIIRNVIRGVAYLHSENLMHGDIRAESVIVLAKNKNRYSKSYKVKIDDSWIENLITEYQVNVASAPYHYPPEVLLGEKLSKAGDMWSCGVLTYFLLFGRCPFQTSVLTQSVENIMSVRMDFTGRKLSNEAKNFIKRLVTFEPRHRMTASQCLGHSWLKKLK